MSPAQAAAWQKAQDTRRLNIERRRAIKQGGDLPEHLRVEPEPVDPDAGPTILHAPHPERPRRTATPDPTSVPPADPPADPPTPHSPVEQAPDSKPPARAGFFAKLRAGLEP